MQRMIGMEIDVTQEHQTKDELTRLYSLLSDETATIRRDRERIFEMTADLMAVGKADGTLLSVNPAWSKVLGFSESELRDISLVALFRDTEASLWDQVSEELMSLPRVRDIVEPLTARAGSRGKVGGIVR